ncbi:MAG: PDZ domain-containing protein [Planctomycetales bacterium]|nr:PDZ domain-containing protein [Planctomycetales bacterium]
MRRPEPWRSWQRSEDYYSEGQLIWLDADTLIREKTRGKRSLDDFAKAFFGINSKSYVPVTYQFDDVVEMLNNVERYDWAAFLRERLDGNGPGAPLDGLKRGGYTLVYKDKPSDYVKTALASRKSSDFTYSVGFSVRSEGKLSGVQWDGPAYRAGLTVGDQLVAVNNIAYSSERLGDAITAAKDSTAPIELLVKDGDRYRTVKIDYHDGLRYPHLERFRGVPARLDDILKAR